MISLFLRDRGSYTNVHIGQRTTKGLTAINQYVHRVPHRIQMYLVIDYYNTVQVLHFFTKYIINTIRLYTFIRVY